jgi:glutamate-1-semialdehyde 2,1-aminomutase
MMDFTKSRALFERARQRIPGGVNSPVRAFAAVGGSPVFISEAEGARIRDVDGNDYIDYVGSWGPMILGHGHPEVRHALEQALARGTSFGAPTEAEVELAEIVSEIIPSVEVLRLVSSGTEATMSAIRLARAFTGRDKIVKFRGGYHGHADGFLVAAGSGAATLGVPSSPGVPEGTARDTLVAEYNDAAGVRQLFEDHSGQIACVVVEPVSGNMGCVPPDDGFLAELRSMATQAGALLVFDEVMTGFRVAAGGAQAHYGVKPDITTLGKVIGGGLPVGAYGGRGDIMRQVAPEGPVYQAGTLSGNPLATAAGLATLRRLRRDSGVYTHLERLGAMLDEGFADIIERTGWPVHWQRVGAMGTLFFRAGAVRNWDDAADQDGERFAAFFQGMLHKGHYLPPSAFEALFLSAAHTEEHVETLLRDAETTLGEVFS